MKKLLTTSTLMASMLATPVFASWTLDNANSQLHFISVKNTSVAEVNQFEQLSGSISDDGKVSVDISLNSVNTRIDIRNERLRNILFETNQFPSASATAMVDGKKLAAMAVSDAIEEQVTVKLTLHGQSRDVPMKLKATRISEGKLQVSTVEPVILSAGDYQLEGGLEALRTIAKLDSISTAVPVTLNLVFDKQ